MIFWKLRSDPTKYHNPGRATFSTFGPSLSSYSLEPGFVPASLIKLSWKCKDFPAIESYGYLLALTSPSHPLWHLALLAIPIFLAHSHSGLFWHYLLQPCYLSPLSLHCYYYSLNPLLTGNIVTRVIQLEPFHLSTDGHICRAQFYSCSSMSKHLNGAPLLIG